jgi:arginyl-tRNA synthetase
VPESTRLEHVAFGSVLGPDKKMLKTRAGDSVRLAELVSEAIALAAAAVAEKAPDLPADKQAQIAAAVGVGAIKYADLSSDRIKDYVFDWKRMLAFDGNTAPYLMYAHARIRSILRKAAEAGAAPGAIVLEAPQERALALTVVQLAGILDRTAETLQPHRICAFLYDLATSFTAFYEGCPVLKSEGATRVPARAVRGRGAGPGARARAAGYRRARSDVALESLLVAGGPRPIDLSWLLTLLWLLQAGRAILGRSLSATVSAPVFIAPAG